MTPMEMKFILKNTVGNLYWKDREGKYLGCNQAYSTMIGFKSSDDIVGKSDRSLFLDVLDESKIKIIEETDQRIMRSMVEETLEEEGIDKSGKTAFYITKKIPIRDENGKVTGIMGTSIDITKEKKAELAYRSFLENMAHDIRTPFSGIYSVLEILCSNKEFSQETKELIEMAKESSESLLKLLNEVLDVISLGSQPVSIQYFNIRAIVSDVINLMLTEIKRKGLEINVECPVALVASDRFRISRILMNLVGNAIKFTEKGKISIEIHTKPNLEIKVSDTGIGIQEDKLDVIFEKFTKLTPSFKKGEFVGVGAGLYISKVMAKELGGDIVVESQINKGSTFKFLLTA